jgi:heptosyltransferase-2
MSAGINNIFKQAVRRPAESLLKVYLSSAPAQPFDAGKVNRILVFAYHGLGNFIMYTPALKLLRENFPSARIDLQVGNNTGCEEVLGGARFFDNIYNLPYSAGFRAWARRAMEIRDTRYDLTINEFHSHSWPLALLVVASGAPYRLGHVTSPGWSERFSRYSFLFNIPVRMREEQHEIERYLDLVCAINIKSLPPGEARTFIHLTEADRRFAREFLESHGLGTARKLIGMQPGTSVTMRWKQWPVERYRAVVERLLSEMPGVCFLLFGSPSEIAMVEQMASGLGPRVSVAAGKTTVRQVAALIEKCDLLVCNDSGLMHAAGAVGTPVVAIYGPTDIKRTAPLGPLDSVVRHELPCSPCFKLEGDEQVHLCPHHDCLMTIRTEEVFYAIEGALAGQESRVGFGQA